VTIGDLVRYKHDKYRMGVALSPPLFIGDGTQDKYVLVHWMKGSGGKIRWRCELSHLEVKGEGRYEWRQAV
jgi:hypothetical protein